MEENKDVKFFRIIPEEITVRLPEKSNWECELFGFGRQLVFVPNKNEVPNFFWRWMQFVCFGCVWRKRK